MSIKISAEHQLEDKNKLFPVVKQINLMKMADVNDNGEISTINDSEVSCPVCEKLVSSKGIVDHVDRCIFLRQEDEVPTKSMDSSRDSTKDGKRSFPLFEKNHHPAPKKMKLSPGGMGGNKRRKTIDLTSSPSGSPPPEKAKKVEEESTNDIPLAEKVRPKTMEEFIG